MANVTHLKEENSMIRLATEADIPQILDIFNDNILHSTAVYLYTPQTLEERLAWFRDKQQAGFPLFVYVEGDVVCGYATYGPFRAYEAYQFTVEHSVYVHKDHYKKGIATKLMAILIDDARKAGKKTMIGCIEATNEASIIIHEKLGFTYSGTIKNAGYKFERWLDLALYQLDLN